MNEAELEAKESIFVIGFPKSGNTWLARLLAEITDSNLSPRNLIDAADYSSKRQGKYLIHKEHVVQNIDEVLQCKVVYIIRDVRDVLLSWFFHCNKWALADGLVKKTIFYEWYFNREILKSNRVLHGNPWSELYIMALGILKTIFQRRHERVDIGSWSDHVTYWKNQPGVIVVRYEDLLKDTEGAVRKILGKLKINVDADVLRESIDNQSFEKKKLEFMRTGNSQNEKFLRSGKIGDWANLLPSLVVEAIETEHQSIMTEYGYLT